MRVFTLVALALPVLVPGLALIASLKTGAFAKWRKPIDGGRTWRGKPVFGENKTWFGVAIYPVGGTLIAGLVGLVGSETASVFEVPRGLAVGATVGAAYTVGELANSFVKRRLGIAAGHEVSSRWRYLQLAVDLADGIFLASVVYALWGVPVSLAIALFIFGVALHVSTDVLMHRLSLKRREPGRSHHGNGEVIEAARAKPLDGR